MFYPEFNLGDFLGKNPDHVDAPEASRDLVPLGPALLQVVGFHEDKNGEWVGQKNIRSAEARGGELSVSFWPSPLFGEVRIVEYFTDRVGIYAKEAFLPLNERVAQSSFPNARIATNIGPHMDCLYIPVPLDTEAEKLTRGYTTAQELTQDVLDHYGVTL